MCAASVNPEPGSNSLINLYIYCIFSDTLHIVISAHICIVLPVCFLSWFSPNFLGLVRMLVKHSKTHLKDFIVYFSMYFVLFFKTENVIYCTIYFKLCQHFFVIFFNFFRTKKLVTFMSYFLCLQYY